MGGCGPCLQRVRVAEKALEVRDGALEPAAAAVVADLCRVPRAPRGHRVKSAHEVAPGSAGRDFGSESRLVAPAATFCIKVTPHIFGRGF